MAEERDGGVRERRRVGDPDVVGGKDDRAPGSPPPWRILPDADAPGATTLSRPCRTGSCACSTGRGEAHVVPSRSN